MVDKVSIRAAKGEEFFVNMAGLLNERRASAPGPSFASQAAEAPAKPGRMVLLSGGRPPLHNYGAMWFEC